MNKQHLRACIHAAYAAAAALTLALPAHAVVIPYGSDERNCYDEPVEDPKEYEIEIKGDVTGIVPEQILWEVINPWAWAKKHLTGYTVNPTKVFYDAEAGVTRIIQSGNLPLPPVPDTYPYSYAAGNGHRTYHTGINMGNPNNPSGSQSEAAAGFPQFEIVSRHWNTEGGVKHPLDAVTLSWDGSLTRKTKTTALLTTYIRTADPETGVHRSGFWADTLYDPSEHKRFTIRNSSDRPFVIDSFGYIPDRPVSKDPKCRKSTGCRANWLELGSLDADHFPPPGDHGSRFTRVKLPKKPIPPGGSFSFEVR